MLEIHANFAIFLFTNKPRDPIKHEEAAREEVNNSLRLRNLVSESDHDLTHVQALFLYIETIL